MDTETLTHPVNPTEVEAIFNSDEAGIFTDAVVVIVKTEAGSTYRITLTGPTVTITRDNKPVLVRKAQYVRTIEGQNPQKTVEKYVGFSDAETPQLLFFSFHEEEDAEHTRMSAPMSSPLRPDMEVAFVL